jgi:hypothetical protein
MCIRLKRKKGEDGEEKDTPFHRTLCTNGMQPP